MVSSPQIRVDKDFKKFLDKFKKRKGIRSTPVATKFLLQEMKMKKKNKKKKNNWNDWSVLDL